MRIVPTRPATANVPTDYPDPERGKRCCQVEAGPDDGEAAQEDAYPGDAERTHGGAIVARGVKR